MQATLCNRDGDGDGDGDGCGLSLPEDIILEVLVRLPAKDLCRFRCVSKGWRALISDPSFVAAQRSRAGPLIVAMFGSEPEHELRLLDKDGNVLRVFDYVRGRASLAPTRLDLILVDRAILGAMFIDPASGRDFTVVGTNDPPWPLWNESWSLIIVDDYSFGRATPSGDYKVLRLHLTSLSWRGRSQWCEVATIMDGGAQPSWRRRPWGPFDQTRFMCEYKATVNGVLYFMPQDIDFASLDMIHIAAFDLESEEWKPETIKGPLLGLKKEEEDWYFSVTELKGTLCFVHNIWHLENLVGRYANIWLLMDHNRSIWVKEYTIQMPETLLFTKPLDVLGDGSGTILLLLNKFQKAGNIKSCHQYILQYYNSSTETFTDFMEMAEGFNGKMAFYTGSLLS